MREKIQKTSSKGRSRDKVKSKFKRMDASPFPSSARGDLNVLRGLAVCDIHCNSFYIVNSRQKKEKDKFSRARYGLVCFASLAHANLQIECVEAFLKALSLRCMRKRIIFVSFTHSRDNSHCALIILLMVTM